jgi:hypothetical protein
MMMMVKMRMMMCLLVLQQKSMMMVLVHGEGMMSKNSRGGVVGKYELLLRNAGIASMHTAVTHLDTVVLLDRTDIGPSRMALPPHRCRDDAQDLALKHDCTAHSALFTPGPNTIRPLLVLTDTWCSSGAFLADGTLLHTGGDFDGKRGVRTFRPCAPGSRARCDWAELPDASLAEPRWYATDQLLPDGRVIVVGGRSTPSYEFLPPRPSGARASFFLQFLADAADGSEGDNLYPFVHLLPDGHLFVFANRDSVLLDYQRNSVIRTYPRIPGNPRNYPSAGSSVLLPLDDGFRSAEVLVCGGAQLGAFARPGLQPGCSDTCGRMVLTSPEPRWAMEAMPIGRCMGDMILLPNRDVLIINGARNGSQGWGYASSPALNPVVYRPEAPPESRFVVQPPATIPRMYHSTANLLSDGRVLIAGSNPHQFYTFDATDFPTELRVETWRPFYFNAPYRAWRPDIRSSPSAITYATPFNVTFSCPRIGAVEINLVSSYFTTHSFSQGQRLLRLHTSSPPTRLANSLYAITVIAPPNPNVAPPAYYMMFPIVMGIPGVAKWVRVVAPP